jgi:hypothetical protein
MSRRHPRNKAERRMAAVQIQEGFFGSAITQKSP